MAQILFRTELECATWTSKLRYVDKHLSLTYQLWDVAGQDRFRSFGQTFYRGAHGLVVAFSLAVPRSLENAKWHLEDFISIVRPPPEFPVLLLGCKCDLDRVVCHGALSFILMD